jgi:hypothetical protein
MKSLVTEVTEMINREPYSYYPLGKYVVRAVGVCGDRSTFKYSRIGINLEQAISKWYRGNVCFITDLRPNSIIKDEAIPMLLQKETQSTFITINERDFWRKVAINESFCLVCFTFPDSKAKEISLIARDLI